MTETFGPPRHFPVRFHSFPGFYESSLSQELDHQEEQDIEHLTRDRQDEDGIPPELRLTEEQFGNIIRECADYGQMHEGMAEAYAEALDEIISERLEIEAGISFHSLWSPREYNYSTDELTLWVPEPTMRNLMIRSLANGHDILGAALIEMFSERPGFIPSYSNDVSEWVRKPLAEWDEIEMGVLLEAVMMIGLDRHDEKLPKAALYALCEGEASYNIYSSNVDWSKFDEKVAEARAELEEEHRKTIDPDYVPPPMRCNQTIDMFQERYAA